MAKGVSTKPNGTPNRFRVERGYEADSEKCVYSLNEYSQAINIDTFGELLFLQNMRTKNYELRSLGFSTAIAANSSYTMFLYKLGLYRNSYLYFH